jgi:hypothetical protein
MTKLQTLKVEISRLMAENDSLRKDASEVFIKEMMMENGSFDITLTTGIAPVFAYYVREMMKVKGGTNFITMAFSTRDDHEKYYMTMGKCTGLTVEEKYMQVCDELKKLKRENK